MDGWQSHRASERRSSCAECEMLSSKRNGALSTRRSNLAGSPGANSNTEPEVNLLLQGTPAPRCPRKPIRPKYRPRPPPNSPSLSNAPPLVPLPIDRIMVLRERLDISTCSSPDIYRSCTSYQSCFSYERSLSTAEVSEPSKKPILRLNSRLSFSDRASSTSSSQHDLSIDLNSLTNSDHDTDSSQEAENKHGYHSGTESSRRTQNFSSPLFVPSYKNNEKFLCKRSSYFSSETSSESSKSAARRHLSVGSITSSKSSPSLYPMSSQRTSNTHTRRSADLICVYVDTVSNTHLAKYLRPCVTCHEPCCVCPDSLERSEGDFNLQQASNDEVPTLESDNTEAKACKHAIDEITVKSSKEANSNRSNDSHRLALQTVQSAFSDANVKLCNIEKDTHSTPKSSKHLDIQTTSKDEKTTTPSSESSSNFGSVAFKTFNGEYSGKTNSSHRRLDDAQTVPLVTTKQSNLLGVITVGISNEHESKHNNRPCSSRQLDSQTVGDVASNSYNAGPINFLTNSTTVKESSVKDRKPIQLLDFPSDQMDHVATKPSNNGGPSSYRSNSSPRLNLQRADNQGDSGNCTFDEKSHSSILSRRHVSLSLMQLSTAAQCARILADSLEGVLQLAKEEVSSLAESPSPSDFDSTPDSLQCALETLKRTYSKDKFEPLLSGFLDGSISPKGNNFDNNADDAGNINSFSDQSFDKSATGRSANAVDKSFAVEYFDNNADDAGAGESYANKSFDKNAIGRSDKANAVGNSFADEYFEKTVVGTSDIAVGDMKSPIKDSLWDSRKGEEQNFTVARNLEERSKDLLGL